MASAEVMRNKGHLEAGKRKLEEFRRRKAGKGKKTTSVSQPHASDGALPEKQTSEMDHVRLTESNGAGTSDANAVDQLEPSGIVVDHANKESDHALRSDFSYSSNTSSKPSFLENSNYVGSFEEESSHSSKEIYRGEAVSLGSDGSRSADDKYLQRGDDSGELDAVVSGIGKDYFLAPRISNIQENDYASSISSYNVSNHHPSTSSHSHEKVLSNGNFSSSTIVTAYPLPNNSVTPLLHDKLTYSGRDGNSLTSSPYQDFAGPMTSSTGSGFGGGQKVSLFSDMVEKKSSDSVVDIGSVNASSPWTFDLRHTDYSSQSQSSLNYAPPSPPAAGRRSRPSFLDSINISKDHSPSPLPFEGSKADSSDFKVYPMDGLRPSANSSIASGDGFSLFNHVKEDKHEFFSRKQNEDFAALEQHIEDLTQEKYSLHRAVEASRALAESLASENSALTDNFNQQGSVVNQLKFELEALQDEMKALLRELEAARIEYANAQLECDAADERAKLLASELIDLEEKSLRVRSNELKMERQLESSQSELASYRKKLSILEKDRQDLQSTVDALKEEKKMLESKLRKASVSGNSTKTNKPSNSNKDVSTSTEDLVDSADFNTSNSENIGTSMLGGGAPSSRFSYENVQDSLEVFPLAIPTDQLGVIQNINTLMAELALEKDQLTQALTAESSQSSKLLDMNKELTRKLEAQTQRLELLTAQNMANDNTIQLRQPEPRTVLENPTYADEGDEVVERVLGWIMKLFPGGPSKRRTSKNL